MLDRHAPWWPTTVPTSMCKYSLDHLQINAPAPWTDASTSSGRLFLPKHMSAYDLFLYFFEAYIYFLENLVSSLKFLCNVKWVSWVFLSFGWLFTYDTVILMFILPTPRSKCSLITVVRETFEAIVINQGTFMKKATSLQHTDREWALAHWKSKGNPDLFTCEHLPSCVISRRSFPLHASAVPFQDCSPQSTRLPAKAKGLKEASLMDSWEPQDVHGLADQQVKMQIHQHVLYIQISLTHIVIPKRRRNL